MIFERIFRSFLGGCTASVLALASAGASSTEVDVLAETIRETKEVINESEAARRKLLGSLYAINLRMKKISKDKGKLTDELMQSQDGVETVATAIQTLEIQIDRQRRGLKKRLRTLYKISGESFVGAVFSTKNAYEFDSTLRNLKLVSDKDFQMIQSYRLNLSLLAQQRKKLKTQVERLLIVEKRIRKQERLLAQEHQAKSTLASSIEKDTRKRISEIRRLRKTRSADDTEIAHLLKPSIYEKKGSLIAPISTEYIIKDFGLRIDEKFKFKMSHKGWQIAVSQTTGVVATDEGVVAFTGPLPGYGATLILDHGDHYYSVYSGLSSIKVSVGDEVPRSGFLGQAETGLYFEIRHFSEPENPASWISAKSSLLTQQNASLESKQAKANFE